MLTQLFSLNSDNKMRLFTLTKRYIGIPSLIIFACFIAIKLAWSQPYQEAEITSPSIYFSKVSNEDINAHYAYSGNPNKLGLLFIHGTPGGWAAFEGYLANSALQQFFFMVSVDRPGWGQSHTENKALNCLLYTSPSPRDLSTSRMPSSA